MFCFQVILNTKICYINLILNYNLDKDKVKLMQTDHQRLTSYEYRYVIFFLLTVVYSTLSIIVIVLGFLKLFSRTTRIINIIF